MLLAVLLREDRWTNSFVETIPSSQICNRDDRNTVNMISNTLAKSHWFLVFKRSSGDASCSSFTSCCCVFLACSTYSVPVSLWASLHDF